jgi:CubicO group peptidase (beta-lactamase class C family)
MRITGYCIVLALSAVIISCRQNGIEQDKIPQGQMQAAGEKLTDFTIKIQLAIQDFQKSNKIPGLSFAIFDSSEIIFSSCYGKSTSGNDINDSTLFSIQSISKNITALAIMKAVEEGLLDLNTRVTQYLPEFRINSCFEDYPEQRINLSLLLSHRAGFTHEAPAGNNFDFRPCDPADHLSSIFKTWLKFPAGSNYSYSNLGFDLAAGILSRASGMSFNDYLKTRIFQPAGMLNTTASDKEASHSRNMTDGSIRGLKKGHYPIPLEGSGSVYTCLTDLVRYTRMLMNYGEINNTRIVGREHLLVMFRIRSNNYGFGTYLDKQDDISFVNHNGGGFGYSATLLWFPEYGLGSVLLCNKPCNTFDFCFKEMKDYISFSRMAKNEAIFAIFDSLNKGYLENRQETDRYRPAFCKCDSVFKPEWEKYAGKYVVEVQGMELKWYAKIARFLGFGLPKITIREEGNLMKSYGFSGESVLREFEPGLFLTNDNEVLDLRTDQPSFRNILLRKR